MLRIPPTILLLLAAEKGTIQKSLSLYEKYWEFSRKDVRRKDQRAEEKKDKKESVTRLGRRTTEEIVKWNQMTALRFQTGGRRQTFLASPHGICCGKDFQPGPLHYRINAMFWHSWTGKASSSYSSVPRNSCVSATWCNTSHRISQTPPTLHLHYVQEQFELSKHVVIPENSVSTVTLQPPKTLTL